MDEQAPTAPEHRDDVPLRRQVLRILGQHPAGLSPGEIAALIASVASVGPDISATARSALTRLLEALQHPTPNRSFDP